MTIVSYPLAKLLKEKGFDRPTTTWRQHGEGISGDVEGRRDFYNRKGESYTALPNISDVIFWLYDELKIWISVQPTGNDWSFILFRNTKKSETKGGYSSQEDAYEAAIEMSLVPPKLDIYENLDLLPEDIHGWNGDSIIFETLIRETQPKIIIEVGTWKGLSAINMGKTLKKFGLSSKIYCVDTWLGSIEFLTTQRGTTSRNLLLKNGYPQIYYQFLSNVVHNDLQDVITPIPTTSIDGFRYFKHNNIYPELIYIDASHEEEDVYRDLENYYQLLLPGGIIFGDDYNNFWPSVIKAVNKFAKQNNIPFSVLEDNFWVIEKQ